MPAKTLSLDLLNLLEWKRFEEVCAAYFETLAFRSLVTRTGADGGVDMHLFVAGEDKPSIVVRCKAWKTYEVGVEPIKELLGVMSAARVSEGVFVTTGTFTAEAYGFAGGRNIHLIDGPDLVAKLRALAPEPHRAVSELATAGDYTTPTCPSCAIKMIRQNARAGGDPYWGCANYPRCNSTLRITRLRERAF
jgi:restriction system protein